MMDAVNKSEIIIDGLVVSMLTIRPKVCGSNLAEGDKNPQHAFLWKGSKAVGPMS
jgi:hypothetical protein